MTIEKNDELICYCIKVAKQTIIDSIQNGNTSLPMIKMDTKACTGSKCKELNPSGKCCSGDIKKLIEKYSTSRSNDNFSSCCCS